MKALYGVGLSAGLMLLAVVGLPFAHAQRGPGPGPQGRMYDPATETTIKGTVEEVRTVSGRHGWNGIHLMLKAEKKTLDVHLGPESFLKEKGFAFAKGDHVEVVGSKVSYGGGETIIAREVKKDGKTLVLRNAQGIPEWSGGWRR